MKFKNSLKFTAVSSKVIMTIVILLFVLFIVQIITIEVGYEIYRMSSTENVKKEAVEAQKQLSETEKQLERIRDSSKVYSSDGTLLQVYDTSEHLLRYGRRANREKDNLQI